MTCSLKFWLINRSKFNIQVKKKLKKAQTVEIQIQHLMQSYRLTTALIQRIQIVVK